MVHMVGKFLKPLFSSFLVSCSNRVMEAQKMTDELFPNDGEGGARGELDALVTQIDLDLVDDYPASDPRWAESVPDGEGQRARCWEEFVFSLLVIGQSLQSVYSHYTSHHEMALIATMASNCLEGVVYIKDSHYL